MRKLRGIKQMTKRFVIKSESGKPVFDKTEELDGMYYYMGWMIFIFAPIWNQTNYISTRVASNLKTSQLKLE